MKKFLSILLISLAIILVLNSCGNYTIIVQKNTTTSPTEKPTIPAHVHIECIDAAVDPTCTQTGLTKGSHCSDCGMIFTPQEVIPMLDHTYDDQYDDTCNECGYIRDAECAHTETEVIEGKDATCTEIGYTDGAKCVKCGEILLEQTEIPMLEHTYTSEVTPPTSTEMGYTTYTCKCGDSYVSDFTDINDYKKAVVISLTGNELASYINKTGSFLDYDYGFAAPVFNQLVITEYDEAGTETTLDLMSYTSVTVTGEVNAGGTITLTYSNNRTLVITYTGTSAMGNDKNQRVLSAKKYNNTLYIITTGGTDKKDSVNGNITFTSYTFIDSYGNTTILNENVTNTFNSSMTEVKYSNFK